MASVSDRVSALAPSVTKEPQWGASSWTRFRLPLSTSLDWHALRTNLIKPRYYGGAWIGRIEESRQECVLLIRWYSIEHCKAFMESSQWVSIIGQIKQVCCQEPETTFVQFQKYDFVDSLSVYVEIRTAYFSTMMNDGQIIKIWNYRGFPGPYLPNGHSRVGMGFEIMQYNGQDVIPCIWIQHWFDPHREYKHKFVHTATVTENGEERVVSAEEGFLNDIRCRGSLGWSLYHIQFDTL